MAHNEQPDERPAALDGDSQPNEAAKKAAKVARDKERLQAGLAAGDFSTHILRVAALLNTYPEARNSDVTLALKYWETFQPDLFNVSGIKPRDLFKLERFHLIVRARAKIQNEYGLFKAEESIRRHRRSREENMRDDVIAESAPARIVRVFADETGKTQARTIVASIWILNAAQEFRLSQAITRWRDRSGWGKREIHFSKFGSRDKDHIDSLLDVIKSNSAYVSFKMIGVSNTGSVRTAEDRVARLHSSLIIRGMEHEVKTGRLDLPRRIEVLIDADNALDEFVMDGIESRVREGLDSAFPDGGALLGAIGKAESRTAELVQVADLIGGAANRRVHPQPERGPKDDLADLIIERLGLSVPSGDSDEEFTQDASAMLTVTRAAAPSISAPDEEGL